MHTIPVGFWYAPDETNKAFPRPEECIDRTWDEGARARMVVYLKSGQIVNSYRGMSSCRICQIHNGSHDLSDGTYVWPSGYAHYVSAHGIKPPEKFLATPPAPPAPKDERSY